MSCIRIWIEANRRTIGLVLLLALALSGCSRDGEVSPEDGGPTSRERAVSASRPEAGTEVAISGDTAVGEADMGETATGAMAAREGFDRKIVKTAELGITSDDVRGSASGAQRLASRFGGTTSSSQTYRADNAVYADIVVVVPSEEFEKALGEMRQLGEAVTTDTVSGQDVTEEYVDLQSRERNLLAAEQSLLDLYDRSEDVQDALSIQRELTVVGGEIEQIQGRIQYLKQSSDTSRISLSIRPVASPPNPAPAWDPALIVARAWTASLTVLQGFAAAVISALVFGWWIIPLLGAGAWWLRRRVRRSGFVPQAPESSQGEP